MSRLMIKGMKMPTDCTKCRFCDDETLYCWATRGFISGFGNPKYCPLEEVPEHETVQTKWNDAIEKVRNMSGCDEVYIVPKDSMTAYDADGNEYKMQMVKTSDLATDCISRQAAIEAICNTSCGAGCGIPCDEICALEEVPSAQPDIIACGDCKHWINHDRRCGFWNHGVRIIDWCSRAERRTDAAR